jgi:3-oxoadipate enol-lactonase
MSLIKINDVKLNYEIDGNGLALVFINGLTMNVNGWFFQVPAFKERYTVVRYDCRGQGQSDKPDMEYTQEMHADDLKKLMDGLSINKAHIVGLSNGGMIAQHFIVKYPERVGALVLVDTCSHIDTLLQMIIKAWITATEMGGSEFRYDLALPVIFSESYIKNNLDAIMAMREQNIKINPPKPVINLAKGSLKHNINDRISEIKAPTLIIVGEEDILIPQKYSRILNEGIKGSKLVIIKDCGHIPPIEKPEEFNRLVLDFLKDYDGLLE